MSYRKATQASAFKGVSALSGWQALRTAPIPDKIPSGASHCSWDQVQPPGQGYRVLGDGRLLWVLVAFPASPAPPLPPIFSPILCSSHIQFFLVPHGGDTSWNVPQCPIRACVPPLQPCLPSHTIHQATMACLAPRKQGQLSLGALVLLPT